MIKYLFLWLINCFLLFAQLTPLQRFQDINALNSVIVVGDKIIVATDQGKLLTSSDNGNNWDELAANVPSGINKLTNAGSSVLFGCGDNGNVIRSTDNGLSWQKLTTNTSSDLIAITSINSNTLVACGKSGTIIKTTDRGDTWNISANGSFNLNDIQFSTHLTGWIAADNGIVLKTSDGGNTWARVPGASADCDLAVVSLYSETGIAIFGREGQVVTSTNGGNDWIYGHQTFYMIGDTVIAAWHISNDTVLYADDRGSIVMFVIQSNSIKFGRYGGQSPNHGKYLSAFKTDDKWFYVAGVGPNLSRAYGSSTAWSPLIVLLKGTELWNLRFADNKVGVVCGKIPGVSFYTQGFVYTTTDGGLNWRLSADTRPLQNVHVMSPQWLSRIDYSLWFSRDSGRTWQRKLTNPVNLYDVIFVDSLNAYLTNYVDMPGPNDIRSRLYRTTDGGASWPLVVETSTYWFTEMLAGKGGLLWLRDRTRSLLMVSNNHGYNLTSIGGLPSGTLVGGLAQERGYIAFSSGAITFTTSAGFNWTTVYNSSGKVLNAGSNSLNGRSLVVGNNGIILATTNDGETWQELSSGVSKHLSSVALLPDYSYVVGTLTGEFYKGTPPGIFTDVKDNYTYMPAEFTLGNYPNPFNGSTVIQFTLPGNETCLLDIFSSTGTLVFSSSIKGNTGANRFEFEANGLGSGVYFYRLQAGGKALTGKMLLLK
jgi:photosystem II stability/assembly factor-like uncharacterized protein